STNRYVFTVRGSQLIGAQPLGCRDVRSFCAPRIFYACPTCEAAAVERLRSLLADGQVCVYSTREPTHRSAAFRLQRRSEVSARRGYSIRARHARLLRPKGCAPFWLTANVTRASLCGAGAGAT